MKTLPFVVFLCAISLAALQTTNGKVPPKPNSTHSASQPGPVAVADTQEADGRPQDISTQKKQSLPGQNDTDITFFGLFINGVLTLITLGIAITGIIQALAAKRSANTANKSAEFAENALKLTERADILLDSAEIRLPMNNMFDGHSWLELRFRNFGRTRAKNVRFNCSMIIPGVPEGPAISLPEMIIGAGDEQTVSFLRFIEFLNQETFRNVANLGVPCRFVGNVTYEDVFGLPHSTQCSGTLIDPVRRVFRIDEHRAD